MKAIKDFENIQPINTSTLLEPGAYCVQIHKVVDHTDQQKPYLEIFYNLGDPATGEWRCTEELQDPERAWRWCFRIYLSNRFGLSQYRELIAAVEASNPGFRYKNADGAEQTLVGKLCGFVIRHRLYFWHDRTKRTLDLAKCISVDDALKGDFPQAYLLPRDTRTAEQKRQSDLAEARAAKGPDLEDEDIPF